MRAEARVEMRHLKKGRKFGRKTDQRKALIKNLANSLVMHGKIETTEAKAKELRVYVEKKITKSKIDNLSNRRFLARYFAPRALQRLFTEVGPRFRERSGGYTRIIKLGNRVTDAAPMVKIELL